jgi:hypothetical protein
MSGLGSCDGGISGEHLITAAIIELLADSGDFTISGLPWIPDGEIRAVGPNSLKANCLCRKHNSALHHLDDAALKLFTSLKLCLDRKVSGLKFLVSGHDVERWLLKTIKAMAASGNLARGQQKLSGAFSQDIQVIELLDNPIQWPSTAGLYCVMQKGETMENHNRFQIAPLANDNGEISGLSCNILGVSFLLMLEPMDLHDNPHLRDAVFRPNQIVIKDRASTSWLAFSWDDDLPTKIP